MLLIILKNIEKLGGKQLLRMHNDSLFQLVSDVYSEHRWLPWKFRDFSSKGVLTNMRQRQYFVNWMEKQLDIKEINDWYKIKAEVICFILIKD